MQTTRHRIFLLTLALLVNCNLISQTKIDSLKFAIKVNLQKFVDATKKVDSLKFINSYFFDLLLTKIDQKTTPKLFQLNSYDNLNIALSINSNDTSFSYEYFSNDNFESFYKNCWPNTNLSKNERNIILGTAGTFNLISIDTINNVLITKPTHSRNEVYRSNCPGGLSKKNATKAFMNEILGQYQLVIYLNKCCSRVYFIAPPNPNSTFRLRHTSGKM